MTDVTPQEARERIWSEPLTESERQIIERLLEGEAKDDTALWLRHVLTVYDHRSDSLAAQLEAAQEQSLRRFNQKEAAVLALEKAEEQLEAARDVIEAARKMDWAFHRGESADLDRLDRALARYDAAQSKPDA